MRLRRQKPEFAAALVEPNAVRRLKIITDIEVRQTVSIDIAKHGRESPVQWSCGEWPAVFVEEVASSKGNRHEICSADIVVQHIRFAVFLKIPLRADGKTIHQIRVSYRAAIEGLDHQLAIDALKGGPRVGNIHQRRGPVIHHINVGIAVAVDVGDGQRLAAPCRVEDGRSRCEVPVAIIEKDAGAVAGGIDDQIQAAIAIEVNKSRAG